MIVPEQYPDDTTRPYDAFGASTSTIIQQMSKTCSLACLVQDS